MMTQTHLLMAAALFTRPGTRRRNLSAIAGALVPDIAIYGLFAWAAVTGIPQSELWSETYWRPEWQAVFAIANSVPLYVALLAISLVVVRPDDGRARWQSLPALFALAALTHLAGDLPLHNSDAHSHFWPLSDWRFISPVSYWDRDHHAGWVAPLEALLGIVLAVIVFRRFQTFWIRIILGTAILAYLAVPLFFILSL